MPEGDFLSYGGQAIIEGVMMRSPKFFSVACRAPDGTIVRKTEAIEKTWIGRQKWLQKPFLRGTFALLDGMALGHKAMKFASNVQVLSQYQPVEPLKEEGRPDPDHYGDYRADAGAAKLTDDKVKKQDKIQSGAVVFAMVVGLAIGVLLFQFLPNAAAEFFGKRFGLSGTLKNLTTEFVKIFIMIGYLWAISQLKEIRELFRYHGAEHMAINALEGQRSLEIESVQQESRIHPRCGTSFAIIVLLVGLVIFPFVPRYPITGQPGNTWVDVPVRVGIELICLPIIAGISYELLRLAGKQRNQKWVSFAFGLGMATQQITTKPADTKHLEVAVSALQGVLDAEKSGSAPEETEIFGTPKPATASV